VASRDAGEVAHVGFCLVQAWCHPLST
jgi:hypothetical protein